MSEKDNGEVDVASATRRKWRIGKEDGKGSGARAPSLVGAAPRVSARVVADIKEMNGGRRIIRLFDLYSVWRLGDCSPWQIWDEYLFGYFVWSFCLAIWLFCLAVWRFRPGEYWASRAVAPQMGVGPFRGALGPTGTSELLRWV